MTYLGRVRYVRKLGVSTVDAFNEVIQRELAVLPKKALELGLKLD